MFLAVAAYATFATGVLPKWTGWIVAFTAAMLCIACVPAMYFGPVSYRGFYNAGGWGPTIIANFPPGNLVYSCQHHNAQKKGNH